MYARIDGILNRKLLKTSSWFVHLPEPYKNVVKQRKGIDGAPNGAIVFVPILPSSFSYVSSDNVRSVVNKREP